MLRWRIAGPEASFSEPAATIVAVRLAAKPYEHRDQLAVGKHELALLIVRCRIDVNRVKDEIDARAASRFAGLWLAGEHRRVVSKAGGHRVDIMSVLSCEVAVD